MIRMALPLGPRKLILEHIAVSGSPPHLAQQLGGEEQTTHASLVEALNFEKQKPQVATATDELRESTGRQQPREVAATQEKEGISSKTLGVPVLSLGPHASAGNTPTASPRSDRQGMCSCQRSSLPFPESQHSPREQRSFSESSGELVYLPSPSLSCPAVSAALPKVKILC